MQATFRILNTELTVKPLTCEDFDNLKMLFPEWQTNEVKDLLALGLDAIISIVIQAHVGDNILIEEIASNLKSRDPEVMKEIYHGFHYIASYVSLIQGSDAEDTTYIRPVQITPNEIKTSDDLLSQLKTLDIPKV